MYAEHPANRNDIIDAGALPFLYDHCDSSDSRVRQMAIWTLTALAEEEEHRLRMVDSGGLKRMLTILRSHDVGMRRGASDCLVKLSKLLETAPSSFVQEITSQETLSVIVIALKDTDLDVMQSICTILQSLKSSKLHKLMLRLDGLAHLLSYSQRLLNMDGTSEITGNLTHTINTLYVFMPVKYPKNVMVIYDKGHMGTILQMCKHSAYKVRRAAGKLLARLSTIHEAKDKMMGESETVKLLISMCKHRDPQCQLSGVKVIAELAEEPKNRVALVREATLPALFQLMGHNDDAISFQCARAVADLAEAVDNRVAIVYGGLEQILKLMLSDDDNVQEQGMRCLVNLASPAGFACGAESNEVGRFGGLQALQVDDDLDQDDDDTSETESSSEDEFDVVHCSSEEDDLDVIANFIDSNIVDSDPQNSNSQQSHVQSVQSTTPCADIGGMAALASANASLGGMTAIADGTSNPSGKAAVAATSYSVGTRVASAPALTTSTVPSENQTSSGMHSLVSSFSLWLLRMLRFVMFVEQMRKTILERAQLLVHKAAMAEQNKIAAEVDAAELLQAAEQQEVDDVV